MSTQAHSGYYLPHGSHWPFVGSVGLFLMMFGFAKMLNGSWSMGVMLLGMAVIVVMLFGWFGKVVGESEGGFYNDQVDISFRWGMGWFIFSEVMFFGAFFGALFYARNFDLAWMAGDSTRLATHQMLWPNFDYAWPTNGPGRVGGEFDSMAAWGIPALNTLILLSSGVTVTVAHWGLLKNNRQQFIYFLAATVALGFLFVILQAYEYHHAYSEMNLKLTTGIYGTTFFMLTGFHGLHVTLGAIILTVVLIRGIRGHFSPHRHFAFEAASWYWHFVDVVWLFLFIFVYWL
ncbi:MAG: cytochrome c oxidase subunit 3 [Gammaproteobacteria bacterium]